MNYISYFKLGLLIKKYLTPSGDLRKLSTDLILSDLLNLNLLSPTGDQTEISLLGMTTVELRKLDNPGVDVGGFQKRFDQQFTPPELPKAITKEETLTQLDPKISTTTTTAKDAGSKKPAGLSEEGKLGLAIGAGVASAAFNAIDLATMGDKNFSAQSQAIDTAVHGTSSALMSSGNPYAMAAGAALEGLNFLTKAGGQTTLGFDVNIENSGYGNIGHMESKSNRDFLAAVGLGGLNLKKILRQLALRNEQALMALKASNISDEIKFEQEARMNSVDNVIKLNLIALDGGLDTAILAAKHGAKLDRMIAFKNRPKPLKEISPVIKAENGAKLEKIETSEEPNLMPVGAMHKNLNHLDLDEVTTKGIPVLLVGDKINTDDINSRADVELVEYLQSAEIESEEIIFNKELTDFIEEKRKAWHESNKENDLLCLEVGMRLCKEILQNTLDENLVIQTINEKVDERN